MSIPGYRPIPAGYISLLDYAKKHGKDVVSLACAAWRHDIPALKWTLKDRSGVRNDVVKVIVVKEDAICPAYVEPARAAKGSENESAENNYEAKGMKLADFAFELGVSNTQVGEYFIRLGSNIKEIKTQTDYQIMLARMKKLREEIKARKYYGNGDRAGKRKVEPPAGYETVEAAADRLGHCQVWVKTLAKKGRIDSVKVQGCVFVRQGCVYQRKQGNQWTAAKARLSVD